MYTISMDSGCTFYNLLIHNCSVNSKFLNFFHISTSIEKTYNESITQIWSFDPNFISQLYLPLYE